MKQKVLFLSLVLVIIVVIFFAALTLATRLFNEYSNQTYVKPYEEEALSYTIDTLKLQGSLNPNATYRVDKIMYYQDDNAKESDEFPYQKLEFYIKGAGTYVVTMEKNDSGEFEITDFTHVE